MAIVRRSLRALAIVFTLVVGAAGLAAAVTQTAWFKDWLRGYIVREANMYVNGTIAIERLGGNLFYGLELENITVTMDGKPVVTVKDLGLDYSVFQIVSRGLTIDHLRLNQPRVYLQRDSDGWSIARLIKREAREADRQGPDRPIAIDDIGISDGAVLIDNLDPNAPVRIPRRIERIDARSSFKYEPIHYTLELRHLSFRGADPEMALNAFSGGIAVRDDAVYFDKVALRTAETSMSIDGAVEHYLTKPVTRLQITSDKVSVEEVARLVPALAGITLQPAFELKTAGPLDALAVDVRARSSAGDVAGHVVMDLTTPSLTAAGRLSTQHLDLAAILNDATVKSDLTGSADIDVQTTRPIDRRSLRGTIRLRAPRLAGGGYTIEQVQADVTLEEERITIDGRGNAYGAKASAKGFIVVPGAGDSWQYDLHGQVRQLNFRRLPRRPSIPPVVSDVNADYRVRSNGGPVSGEARFLSSAVAGARVTSGSTARVTVAGSDVSYRAAVGVEHLNPREVGRACGIRPLDLDRYDGLVNGQVNINGAGITLKGLQLDANGLLTDSSLFGGRIPELQFSGDVRDDAAHVTLNGRVAEIDPAILWAREAFGGRVSGTADVEVTVRGVSQGVRSDTIEGRATIVLDPSSVGKLAIDRANLDGEYHASIAHIRELNVVGADVHAEASGTLNLSDEGQSTLAFRADTTDVKAVGDLLGVAGNGIARVDGKVTGNRSDLRVAGNLSGNSLTSGTNQALTLSSDYTVEVGNLEFADATVEATTDATFVVLGGQSINVVTTQAEYQSRQLTFEATAKQPERSLTIAGTMHLRPEQQEMRLQRLELESQGKTWQTAPGSNPVIVYGRGSVGISDFALASGPQQIIIDGSFGQADDALAVTLVDVDLASVDALLLRAPQLSGRLNLSSVVSGSREAPRIKGEFAVAQGGFRQFRYETLDGTVDYAPTGITIDSRLQQNSSAWITARGFVPSSAFRARPRDEAFAHHLPASNEEGLDLRVESSTIDLGVVQGLTDAVTDVTGTLQANVRITGSVEDPHPSGAVTVENAAFTVAAAGSSYADGNGRFDLEPDRVHLEGVRLRDDERHELTISGDLAIHERQVGGVSIGVKADEFRVFENEMGRIRVTSDVRLEGELRRPRIEGELGISTGRLNLDPIVAMLGESPYALKPTEYGTSPLGAASGDQVAAGGLFDALQMDVHFTVPDDLIVQGSDLRTPSSPVGLGAMNVTLGGDLRALKNPNGPPRLSGAVRTVRGTYDFQGRRFEILRDGSVSFAGLDELDPRLDIRARRMIEGVEANIAIRGTLKRPELILTSVPPLEQADILALIVFNQPINQLAEGQQISLAERATSLAAGALAGGIASSIGKALSLDTFEIQTAPEGGGALQVAAGQQIGQRAFLRLQQGLGDQGQTNLIFEYQFLDWLRLQSNVSAGANVQQSLFNRVQGSGADLFITLPKTR